jgi:pyruvate formate lyase activating enzyme
VHYAYTGNVHDSRGGSTTCTGCGTVVIERDWYDIRRYALTDDGRCVQCATAVPGRFDGPVGSWGARRMPVRIARQPTGAR